MRPMISDAEARLAAILQRELGAASVRFAAAGEEPEPSPTTLACTAGNGAIVVAEFASPPPDREAKARRLEIIVDSFAELFTPHPGEVARHRSQAPARSLAGELSALAGRAGALCALVVDARSPVIWGASDVYDSADPGTDAAEETPAAHLYRRAAHAGLRFTTLISEPVLDTEMSPDSGSDAEIAAEMGLSTKETAAAGAELTKDERADLWRRVLLVRNALSAVRALPQVVSLHKGEHLHESVRTPEMSYVVRSFATIYMLVVVFERPFDELRAERAVSHALPTIERLVLALPPMDPDPPVAGAGVIRLRRR